MPKHLYHLFSPQDFKKAEDDGYITIRRHPHAPLAIANYSPSAQYDRAWNPVTLNCRGLIWNTETDDIVAKPFTKFFNRDEDLAPSFTSEQIVSITDKMDGSLGVGFVNPITGGFEIATRGSFTSEQAIHANEVLRSRPEYREFSPLPGLTYLFEIIYPENRIVLDYGSLDDLVLLAVLDTTTGATVPTPPTPFPQAPHYPLTTDLAVHAPNKEGYVLLLNTGERVKIKFDEYVRLHKIVFGLTRARVFDSFAEGVLLAARDKGLVPVPYTILDDAPDEFHPAIYATLREFTNELAAQLLLLDMVYSSLVLAPDRKAFAEQATQQKAVPAAALFALYDDDFPRAVSVFLKNQRKELTNPQKLVGVDMLAQD